MTDHPTPRRSSLAPVALRQRFGQLQRLRAEQYPLIQQGGRVVGEHRLREQQALHLVTAEACWCTRIRHTSSITRHRNKAHACMAKANSLSEAASPSNQKKVRSSALSAT